jgi:hypothetical protein
MWEWALHKMGAMEMRKTKLPSSAEEGWLRDQEEDAKQPYSRRRGGAGQVMLANTTPARYCPDYRRRIARNPSEAPQSARPRRPTSGSGLAVFGSCCGAGSAGAAGRGGGIGAAATGTGAGAGASINRIACGAGVAGLAGGGGAVPVVARRSPSEISSPVVTTVAVIGVPR